MFFQFFGNRYAESWVSKHHHTTPAALTTAAATGNEKKRKEKKRKHQSTHLYSRTTGNNSNLNSGMMAPR
jgi:hypothetical protein